MSQPNVLILRAPGTNCDMETAFAFEQAGAKTETLHINRLLEKPSMFERFQILCIPGGFSFGDDIAAGRIFGNLMQHHLVEQLEQVQSRRKIDPGHLQRIPGADEIARAAGIGPRKGPAATLTLNDSGRYEDRWVRLETKSAKCVFLKGIERMYLPVAHAEGKFVARDDETLAAFGLRRATGAAICLATCQRGRPNCISRQSQRFAGRRGGRLRLDRPCVGADAASRAAHRSDATSPLDPRRGRLGGRRAANIRQRRAVFCIAVSERRSAVSLPLTIAIAPVYSRWIYGSYGAYN